MWLQEQFRMGERQIELDERHECRSQDRADRWFLVGIFGPPRHLEGFEQCVGNHANVGAVYAREWVDGNDKPRVWIDQLNFAGVKKTILVELRRAVGIGASRMTAMRVDQDAAIAIADVLQNLIFDVGRFSGTGRAMRAHVLQSHLVGNVERLAVRIMAKQDPIELRLLTLDDRLTPAREIGKVLRIRASVVHVRRP